MEYFCYVLTGASSYYLDMKDKLQKLGHSRKIASLSLFCRYYFDRCSSELAELILLPYSRGRVHLLF